MTIEEKLSLLNDIEIMVDTKLRVKGIVSLDTLERDELFVYQESLFNVMLREETVVNVFRFARRVNGVWKRDTYTSFLGPKTLVGRLSVTC